MCAEGFDFVSPPCAPRTQQPTDKRGEQLFCPFVLVFLEKRTLRLGGGYLCQQIRVMYWQKSGKIAARGKSSTAQRGIGRRGQGGAILPFVLAKKKRTSRSGGRGLVPQERESLGLGLNKGVWGPAAAPDRSVCGKGGEEGERPFCCFVLAKKTHTHTSRSGGRA